MTESLRIDDLECSGLEQPQTLNELQGIVRRAASANQAIYPVGGRTMLDFGLPPTKPGVAVDLTKLDQVIDYPARDMTITVQAGITMAKLQEVLAKEGQRLPIDVPLPERATLGGAIACNVSGPRRYGYGTLRDYVIGITVVNDEGQETKAGGRVVKNVAGYDLCKLHIGALGTLGMVTQVTLKVLPKPEAQAVVVLACPTDDLGDFLESLRRTSTRPTSIDVLWPTPPRQEQIDYYVLVGFEDNRKAVNWQVDRLAQELNWPNPLVHTEDRGERCHRSVDEMVSCVTPITFKANVLPAVVAEFCRMSIRKAMIVAHAGNGIVIGRLTPSEITREQARAAITELRTKAVEYQGNLILLRCPTEWKREPRVWGQPRGDWQLMREIKRQLDPNNLFNPGRFVDGI